MTGFLLVATAAYLIGSINASIAVTRLISGEDPRRFFSGNAGTTNVFRRHGFLPAAAVLILEIGKAWILSLLALKFITPCQAPWICLFLLAGNRFPCFHGFRGGKGVASLIGFNLAVSGGWTAAGLVAWVLAFQASRLPFIASLVMAAVLCVGSMVVLKPGAGVVVGSIAWLLLIAVNHRSNILAQLNASGRRP